MIPVSNWQEIREIETRMRGAKNANILDLFKIAKLDPQRDFRGQDWRFITFDGLDLRGFDFRNSRLYGCSFDGTKVAKAKFDGSDVQVTRLHQASDWQQAELSVEQRQIIAMKALSSGGDLNRETFESIEGWSSIDEPHWVSLIKSARSFDGAHEIYKMMMSVEMGKSKYALTTLLDKASSQSEIAIVKNYIASNKIEVDSHLVSSLISKADTEKEARQIFDLHKNQCKHTQYLYNSLISKCDFLESAHDIIDMMRNDGFEIDEITLNPFIWKAVNFRSALWIYNMLPNPRTADLNAVLSHANWHQYIKTNEALELLKNGPSVNTMTFNIIIGTCDNLRDGLSVIALMRDMALKRDMHCNPDKFTMFGALSLIAKHDTNRAFELLTQFAGYRISIEERDVLRALVRIIDDPDHIARRIVADHWDAEDGRYLTLVELSERFANAETDAKFRGALDIARVGK